MMEAMELRPGIEMDDQVLDEFAHRHAIRRLAAFGSVLRHDFGPASDIDLLVEFDPDHVPGLLAIASMELELEQLAIQFASGRSRADLDADLDVLWSTVRDDLPALVELIPPPEFDT